MFIYLSSDVSYKNESPFIYILAQHFCRQLQSAAPDEQADIFVSGSLIKKQRNFEKMESELQFIQHDAFSRITNLITEKEVGDRIWSGRLELFGAKKSKHGSSHIPPEDASSEAPEAQSSRKLLWDMIFALNQSFPDHDFSQIQPRQFKLQSSIDSVMSVINTNLAELCEFTGELNLSTMWSIIDEAVALRECSVFSYVPDLEDDPFSELALSSQNYFMINEKQKRIVYYTCVVRRKCEDDSMDDVSEGEEFIAGDDLYDFDNFHSPATPPPSQDAIDMDMDI